MRRGYFIHPMWHGPLRIRRHRTEVLVIIISHFVISYKYYIDDKDSKQGIWGPKYKRKREECVCNQNAAIAFPVRPNLVPAPPQCQLGLARSFQLFGPHLASQNKVHSASWRVRVPTSQGKVLAPLAETRIELRASSFKLSKISHAKWGGGGGGGGV